MRVASFSLLFLFPLRFALDQKINLMKNVSSLSFTGDIGESRWKLMLFVPPTNTSERNSIWNDENIFDLSTSSGENKEFSLLLFR